MIIAMDESTRAIDESALRAAVGAAFPGLPEGVTSEEAWRRTRAGVEVYLAATKLDDARRLTRRFADHEPTASQEPEVERWTLIRRRDWPHDRGALIPSSLAPAPDEELEVFDVVRASLLDELRRVAINAMHAIEDEKPGHAHLLLMEAFDRHPSGS